MKDVEIKTKGTLLIKALGVKWTEIMTQISLKRNRTKQNKTKHMGNLKGFLTQAWLDPGA